MKTDNPFENMKFHIVNIRLWFINLSVYKWPAYKRLTDHEWAIEVDAYVKCPLSYQAHTKFTKDFHLN